MAFFQLARSTMMNSCVKFHSYASKAELGTLLSSSKCMGACNFTRNNSNLSKRDARAINGLINAGHNDKLFQPLLVTSTVSTSKSSLFSTDPTGKVDRLKKSLKKSLKQSLNYASYDSLLSTPTPYLLYGIGGLIPFVSVPFCLMLSSTFIPSLAHAQLAYSACILSFLGGVSWGNELKNPEKSTFNSLGYSIALPLVSWVGLLIYPNFISFPLMVGTLAFAGCVDITMKDYPKWFKSLRFFLSSVAAVSLTLTFFLGLIKRSPHRGE